MWSPGSASQVAGTLFSSIDLASARHALDAYEPACFSASVLARVTHVTLVGHAPVADNNRHVQDIIAKQDAQIRLLRCLPNVRSLALTIAVFCTTDEEEQEPAPDQCRSFEAFMDAISNLPERSIISLSIDPDGALTAQRATLLASIIGTLVNRSTAIPSLELHDVSLTRDAPELIRAINSTRATSIRMERCRWTQQAVTELDFSAVTDLALNVSSGGLSPGSGGQLARELVRKAAPTLRRLFLSPDFGEPDWIGKQDFHMPCLEHVILHQTALSALSSLSAPRLLVIQVEYGTQFHAYTAFGHQVDVRQTGLRARLLHSALETGNLARVRLVEFRQFAHISRAEFCSATAVLQELCVARGIRLLHDSETVV